ncbi:uncharacterized protein LOC124814384 isoform X1 [Hydra vulgaris]|uniref:uncharacterized protein LOC124814384 isoform X1 n=1 Tax=Hydra vulgaris TaxID=6087 RepID=UPI0032EA7D9F
MNTDYYFKVNVLELNNLTINKIMISSRLILVNAKTNMFSDKINFTATNATYNSILLNWYPFKAVILYKVEYSINGSVNETQNVMTSNSSIELTNLISNKTYRMKLFVVAINGIISEDQLQSNDLLYSTLKEKAKFEVLMLNLTAGMITSESIFVTWTSFEDATQFQVMCVTNTTRGTPLYLTTNSTFLNITNLQSGTQYEITVYVSEILNTIPTITKKSLTLTTKTREKEISKKSDVSKKNNSENRFLYSKLTIPVFAIVAIFFILS